MCSIAEISIQASAIVRAKDITTISFLVALVKLGSLTFIYVCLGWKIKKTVNNGAVYLMYPVDKHFLNPFRSQYQYNNHTLTMCSIAEISIQASAIIRAKDITTISFLMALVKLESLTFIYVCLW